MIKYIPVIFNNKIAVGYQTMFTLCDPSNTVGMESSFNIHKIDNEKWLSFNIRFGKEIPRKQLTKLPTNCKINYHTTRISFDSPKRVTMSPILYRIIRSL